MADSVLDAGSEEGALRRLIADNERVLQDKLEAELNRRGFKTVREMVVVPRDRVDVAVLPNPRLETLTLVEVKIADPIRGVGQVLSYQVGAGEPTHCVLVIDWTVFNSQVARACAAAGIELWVMREGNFDMITGPPTLWNASRNQDEPVYEHKPFEPGPVETCPCCEGVGKVREDVMEAFDADQQRGVPASGVGDGTGVVKRNS